MTVLYASRPYDVAVHALAADLIVVAVAIESWSEETILGTGKRVPIRRPQVRTRDEPNNGTFGGVR
jgi:hypothetical protein